MSWFDMRGRTIQVGIAGKLLRHNHILNATARAVWSHIYKNGFKVIGPIDEETVQTVYVRLVRDAVRSLIGFGYFALGIDGKEPFIVDPESYLVVGKDHLIDWESKSSDDFHAVFIDQVDCDRFRKKPPRVFVQFSPLSGGQLTCPAMQLVDMHDAIVEFTRLALINDGINVRPKAWASLNDDKKHDGVFHFLEDDDFQSRGMRYDENLTRSDLLKTKRNRERQGQMVAGANEARKNLLDETTAATLLEDRQKGYLRGPFASACLSRVMDMNSVRDPSLLIDVMPNTTITQMAATHTRGDLVDLIRLYDQRMCNAMGIPPTLIGLPAPNNVSNHDDEAVRLWENIINPIRDVINIALVDAIAKTTTKWNAIRYKKTHDREFLKPVRIEIKHTLSMQAIFALGPYLTEKAFNRHLATCTGLDIGDFRPQHDLGIFAVKGGAKGGLKSIEKRIAEEKTKRPEKTVISKDTISTSQEEKEE
jgi:hypothetical protein